MLDLTLSQLADQLDPPHFRLRKEDILFDPPDIVDWAHSNFVDPVMNRLVTLEDHQQRILRTIMDMVWAKKVTTMVYSDIKKSGKTTLAGLVGAYWAENVEAPNEIISIANDKEQAQGRIYGAMVPTMRRLKWTVPEMKPEMRNSTSHSVVKAIGTNYAGEAGGNYGLTLWSELWAYKSEDRKRLWEEMTQVPTRRYSIRWVETYAGFKNESELLWKLYCLAFKDGDESDPQGVQIKGLEDLPIWFMEDSGTVVYWNHIPRMPWQDAAYYATQRAELRPNAFKRLHQNEWVSSEDVFVAPEQWDALENCKSLDMSEDARPLVLGVDAGEYSDNASVVAATWDEARQAPDILKTWIWRPVRLPGAATDARPTIDLSATIAATIDHLVGSGDYYVLAVFYDAYQLHSIMVDLQKKYDRLDTKKLFVKFPQTNARIESDQYLYQLIVSKKLKHDGDPQLREHILNAVVDEGTRGFRLDKALGKNMNKIDAAVASAMACYGASLRHRTKRKFLKP